MEFREFVLAACTTDLADEPDARGVADAVEFRMDGADEPLAAIERYDGELPILATNRAAWEGGESEADEADRLDRLCEAAEHDAVEAIDIELASAREPVGERAIERVCDAGVSVVVSVHDFETTPEREELVSLLDAASMLGDVGKLAVTAEHRDDVLDLLEVTHALDREGRAVATMAMGEAGRHSRAVAPLYGSRIGYAPVDPASATAPGQYDLATLSELIERLS